MSRSREFDRQDVLEKAMGAFWRNGYEATGVADLLDATGLSKSSLYSGFGNKHEIFLAAFDRYREQQAKNFARVLESRPAPEGIRAFFEQIIASASTSDLRFGCMSTNQAIERGAMDAAVRERVDRDYQRLEEGFIRHLRQGQGAGTVPADSDVAAAASALVTAFSGFQLTVRAGLGRDRLRRSLDYLLAPLTVTSSPPRPTPPTPCEENKQQ